jgi:exosortase A-associated hydrolase 1
VASHRLYVQLARKLIAADIAVLRFDYEGIGDSEGVWRGYKFAGPSIESAILALHEQYPAIRRTTIWALCDGSTASAVFAARRPDLVDAMILCNPYVHSEQGKAQTLIKHYYVRRLLDKEFWHKMMRLRFDVNSALKSLFNNVRQARANTNGEAADQEVYRNEIHPDEFVRSLLDYEKPIRFILSTDDLTAQQFADLCKKHAGLSKAIEEGRITLRPVRGADHTFTTRQSKQQLIQETKCALDALLMGKIEAAAVSN